jgi:oxygen-dependent protoporphyrinogen oxidase
MTPRNIAVVGAGITGLSFAHRLLARAREGGAAGTGAAMDVRVFEAAPRAGGHAHTTRQDGYLIEAGPNGWLDRYEAPRAMVRELGLESSLVDASPAAKRRFVVRGGRLRRAPDSPPTLLTSDALSVGGRLRVLAEALVPARRDDAEETVDAFARRRLGAEAAEVLVDPMIAGITAGDSRTLSLDAAFPMMRALEREHGGLIRGFLAKRRNGGGSNPAGARLVAPRDGMSSLVDAMVGAIGRERIALGTPVRAIERVAPGEPGRTGAPRWRVVMDAGPFDFDDVVLATPANASARLVETLDPALAAMLSRVRFAGVAVVAFAYRASDVPHPLDGYGYLMTRAEERATLGVVWESSLFPGRAPAGHALLRVILGGERRPDVAAMPDDEIVSLARRELEAVLGVRATPVLHGTIAWPNAIAQYVVGHRAIVDGAKAIAARHPGLALAGTSYDGNSFASAVASGRALADRMIERVEAAA